MIVQVRPRNINKNNLALLETTFAGITSNRLYIHEILRNRESRKRRSRGESRGWPSSHVVTCSTRVRGPLERYEKKILTDLYVRVGFYVRGNEARQRRRVQESQEKSASRHEADRCSSPVGMNSLPDKSGRLARKNQARGGEERRDASFLYERRTESRVAEEGEKARRGVERSEKAREHACTSSWNARGVLLRRNHPERLPGCCRCCCCLPSYQTPPRRQPLLRAPPPLPQGRER